MSYYELVASTDQDTGVTRNPPLPDTVFFQAGEWIDESLLEPLVFQCNNTANDPPPDFSKRIIPVLSQRFLSRLQAAGVDNLQTFRAELVNPTTGERWTDFHTVNIIGAIPCAYLTRSRYTAISAGMIEFDEIVLDAGLTREALLFRLAESTRRIIVHSQVIEHLVDRDDPPLTGFDVNVLET